MLYNLLLSFRFAEGQLNPSHSYRMMKEITIKWSSKEIKFEFDDGDTVSTLKRKIEEHTKVQPKRQKLLGLKGKGAKPATDDVLLRDLALKPGQKVMLIGYVSEAVTLRGFPEYFRHLLGTVSQS